jgi:hypothetical protein
VKVRKGRTYLNGEERDKAEAALEDRAWEILGRVLMFPPAKRPKRKKTEDAAPPLERKRRSPAPRITGVSAWCPFGHDVQSIPVKIDSITTDKQIMKKIDEVFADGPIAKNLIRFLQQQRDILKAGIYANRFPGTIDRWFRFLLSEEGTRMSGIPVPDKPTKTVTLPNGTTRDIPPPFYPMSDESIISITESLLHEWGIGMKHSVLRQYLVRTRQRLGI